MISRPHCPDWLLRVTIILSITFTHAVISFTQTTLHFQDISLDSFLISLDHHLSHSISYGNHILTSDAVQDYTIRLNHFWRKDLGEVLKKQDLAFKIIDQNILIFPRQRHLLSGYITDQESGECLPGAHTFLEMTGIGSISNGHGFFQILVPEGENTLYVSYLGYQTNIKHIRMDSARLVFIELSPRIDLPSILVTDSLVKSHLKPGRRRNLTIKLTDLTSYPSLGGTMDILKLCTFLAFGKYG